jgi:hypothetical protein
MNTDTSGLKSWIIKAAVIGFVMAIYSLYGASAWENYINSTGHAGVFEVGLGYMAMAIIGMTISWWLTKSFKPKKEQSE